MRKSHSEKIDFNQRNSQINKQSFGGDYHQDQPFICVGELGESQEGADEKHFNDIDDIEDAGQV